MMQLSSSKIIIGFGVIVLVAAVLLIWTAHQQATSRLRPELAVSVKRIGVIQYVAESDPSFEGLKKGMADLGYAEGGRDIVYEYQLADGDQRKVSEIAESFVDQSVDLIYAITFPSAKAAFEATRAAGRSDIPVVFAQANNPVEGGIVQSYKSSGNNLTGVAGNLVSLTPKKLEILKRIKPDTKTVGFFHVKGTDDTFPSSVLTIASLRENAPKFGITLVEYALEDRAGPALVAEAQKVGDSIQPGTLDAIFLPTGVLYASENLKVISGLGNRLKIPVLYALPAALDIGGLFVYTHDSFAIGEQAAPMVDKIFRGVSPSDIPVESPRRNVLIVNLKNAEEIGITVPQEVLEIAQLWEVKLP